MPKYWYVSKLCTTTLDKIIVTDKKPYYFIYNYSSLKKDYDSYIKNCDLKCVMKGKESKKEKKKEKSSADKAKTQTDYQREKTSKQDKGFNLITKT